MTSEVTVECLDSRDGFNDLEPEWDRLLAHSDVASPFLTPGWQSAWLESYGHGHRLFILTARRGFDLIGLWPLARVQRGAFRVLEPVGAGRSDWLDIPCVPTERAVVLEGFARHLASRAGEWDLIDCRDVLEGSPTLDVLANACAASGLQLQSARRTIAPYLALTGDWEGFLAAKRSKFRTNLKYYRRLAERSCKTFSIVRHGWQADDTVVDTLAAVELRSWKAREGNLKISTLQGRGFYRGFCAYFAERGQLDLWRAECDGELIAFLVNIRFGGKCYHYNTCFDERHANLSLGMLLHADAIADGFAAGLREYDFLSGDEPYKERWSNGKRDISHVAIHSARLRSRLAFGVRVALRWAFRRSERLRDLRARALAFARKILRSGGQ